MKNKVHILEKEGYVFNFFDEIKNKITGIDHNFLNDYNIVNISGKILYVEGHQGLTIITSSQLAFKIKKGRVVIDGENFVLNELTDNTILLYGKINKVEIF